MLCLVFATLDFNLLILIMIIWETLSARNACSKVGIRGAVKTIYCWDNIKYNRGNIRHNCYFESYLPTYPSNLSPYIMLHFLMLHVSNVRSCGHTNQFAGFSDCLEKAFRVETFDTRTTNRLTDIKSVTD